MILVIMCCVVCLLIVESNLLFSLFHLWMKFGVFGIELFDSPLTTVFQLNVTFFFFVLDFNKVRGELGVELFYPPLELLTTRTFDSDFILSLKFRFC